MKLVFLSLVITSLFGLGFAHVSRMGAQSNFVPSAIKHMAGLQMQQWGEKLALSSCKVFFGGDKLAENIDIAWDWDRSVENLFATFEPDKLAKLAKIYGMSYNLETISKKNWLYRFMVNGNTKVADMMVEMGLNLNEVDLQGLLAYALQPDLKKNNTRVNWWEWLLKHGASIDDPELMARLFRRAVLENDVMLLDWMKTNLFADTDTARRVLAQSLNESLQVAVRTGATETAVWLLKHGANTNVLNETDLLRAALLGYLFDTDGVIGLPLAQYVSNVDKNILDDVLYRITRDGVYQLSERHIFTMRHLQNLGAKLTLKKLQETLYRSLTWHKRNWAMANWAIEHGADINLLDLNKLVRNAIKDWSVYNSSTKLPNTSFVNIDAIFDFLHMHGFDHSKLDVAQLLSEAKENNFTAAIAQLSRVGEQVESISTAEIMQELYKELPTTAMPTYVDSDNEDFLLHSAIREYLDKKSFIWLFLYIGKVRGANTTTDTLLEVVRLLPYGVFFTYSDWMDGLIVSTGLAEKKEVVAQEILNRLFQSEEKHPFPLSFAHWAVANGADINQPDQHAVMRAIINNEVMYVEPHRDNKLLIPSLNNIFLFLQKNGFNFETIDQQHIPQETEVHDVATHVLETLNEMRQGTSVR